MNNDTLEEIVSHVSSVPELLNMCKVNKTVSRVCKRMPVEIFVDLMLNKSYRRDYFKRLHKSAYNTDFTKIRQLLNLYPIANVTGNKYITKLQKLYIQEAPRCLYTCLLLFMPAHLIFYPYVVIERSKAGFLRTFAQTFSSSKISKMYDNIVSFVMKDLYVFRYQMYRKSIRELTDPSYEPSSRVDISLLKEFETFDANLRKIIFIYFLDRLAANHGRQSAVLYMTPNAVQFSQTFFDDTEYFIRMYNAFNLGAMRDSLMNNS